MRKGFLLQMILLVGVLISATAAAHGQRAETEPGPIRTSPAYSEILLRKTEILADIEAYAADYTEANPKLIDLRFELAALDGSLAKVFGVKPTETGKLTLALGKLIVKKAALETDLARLRRSYNAEHPEIKRAKRRVEIFDAAIKEVLN